MGVGTIVIIVLVCIALAIAGYFVAMHLKGKIVLHLPVTNFSPGEEIQGSFTITTKKPLESNKLSVVLRAERGTERRSSNGNNTTSWSEIFRDEHQLVGAKSYSAGLTETHDFKIVVPATAECSSSVSTGLRVSIGDVSIGGGREKIRWTLTARLDCPGVDISAKKNIYIQA